MLSGVDAIECDIHNSSDHVPMIIHNNSITSTAYFLGSCEKEHTRDRTKYCSSYSAEELQTYFVLKSPLSVPLLPLNGETVDQQREMLIKHPESFRVPTLRELLILTDRVNRARAEEGRTLVTLNIELKGLNTAIAVLLALSSFAEACAEAGEHCFVPPEGVVLLGKLQLAEVAIANDLICCCREYRQSLAIGPTSPLRYGTLAVAEHYCTQCLCLYLAAASHGEQNPDTIGAAVALQATGSFQPHSVVLFDGGECFLVDRRGYLVRGRTGPKHFSLDDRGDLPLCPTGVECTKTDHSLWGAARRVLLHAVQTLLPHMLNEIVPQKHQPGQIRTQLAGALARHAAQLPMLDPRRHVGSLDDPALLAAAFHTFCTGTADVRCTLMVGQQLQCAAGPAVPTTVEEEPAAATEVTAAGLSLLSDCFARGFSGIDLNLRCCSPSLLSALQWVISSSSPCSLPVYCPTLGVNACRAPQPPLEVLRILQSFALGGTVDILLKVNEIGKYVASPAATCTPGIVGLLS